MTALLLSWLVLSISMYLTAVVLPGFEIKSAWGAMVVAAIFGVLNFAIGWLLFTVIGIATLGLGFLLAFVTRWVVNAILLKVTDLLSSSLRIRSFGAALVGALLISLFGTAGEWVIRAVS